MQVLVLASLATISAIITVALVNGTRSGAYSVALDRQIRGEIAGALGIRRVIAAIESPQDDLETHILAGEGSYSYELGGTRIELQIEGETGKINPIRANAELLAGYVADLPLSDEDGRSFLAEIAAAREREDPGAGMLAVHRYLLPAVPVTQIESDFTLWNQTVGVDPLHANERVLSAVPDISSGEAEQVLRLRKSDPSAIRPLSKHFTAGRPIFSIVATVLWSANEAYSERAPIEISSAGRVLLLEPHF